MLDRGAGSLDQGPRYHSKVESGAGHGILSFWDWGTVTGWSF